MNAAEIDPPVTRAPEPAHASTPPRTPLAERLREPAKTASYLGVNSKTPPQSPAVKAPEPQRRTSGSHPVQGRRSGIRQSPAPGSAIVPNNPNAPKSPQVQFHSAAPTSSPASVTSPAGKVTGSTASMKWHCERCQIPISKDEIINGACKLVQGRLHCPRCQKKLNAAKQLKTTVWLAGGTLLAFFGVSLAFFTQPLLILLLPVGVIAILLAIVGGGLGTSARLGSAAAGMAAVACCFFGTDAIKERNEARKAQQTLESRAAEVEHVIASSNFPQAESQIEALAVQSKDRSGHFVSPEHEKRISELQQRFNEQMRKSYGAMQPQEQTVLLDLLRSFPQSDTASQRFHSVKLADNRIMIAVEHAAVATPRDVAPGMMGDAATLQARLLGVFVFDSYPNVKDVEITVEGGESNGAQKVHFTREQLTMLRMGGSAAPPPGAASSPMMPSSVH